MPLSGTVHMHVRDYYQYSQKVGRVCILPHVESNPSQKDRKNDPTSREKPMVVLKNLHDLRAQDSISNNNYYQGRTQGFRQHVGLLPPLGQDPVLSTP